MQPTRLPLQQDMISPLPNLMALGVTKRLQVRFDMPSVEGEALVRLVGVSKRFGSGSPALHPTNLLIERGRTTVLIGPSGCGKSTLLRLIVGLIDPDSGHVEFEGRTIRPE